MDLYFDDKASSVVEGWVGGRVVSEEGKKKEGDERSAISKKLSELGRKRSASKALTGGPVGKVGGLGYSSKKKGAAESDALAQRLVKHQQQKEKKTKQQRTSGEKQDEDNDNEVEEDDEDVTNRHGVVEDFSFSRTSIKSSADLASEKQKLVVSSQLSKKRPLPVASTSMPVPAAAGAAVLEASSGANAAKAKVMVEQEQQGEIQNKRKRTKTRSKQKNIRRDNRPQDKKPEHLQVGSSKYGGRPITEQTRKILGETERK